MPNIKLLKTRPGKNDVEKWYDALPTKERMSFRTNRLDYLADQPLEKWAMPSYETLVGGPCDGLGQIRAKIAGSQIRLIGFRGPNDDEFTILLFAKKTTRVLPKRVCETAQKRKRRVIARPELAHEWIF